MYEWLRSRDDALCAPDCGVPGVDDEGCRPSECWCQRIEPGKDVGSDLAVGEGALLLEGSRIWGRLTHRVTCRGEMNSGRTVGVAGGLLVARPDARGNICPEKIA